MITMLVAFPVQGNERLCPVSDMSDVRRVVSFLGYSRRALAKRECCRLTQCMDRPCGARRFRRSGRCGLASMYPAFAWSAVLRAIMDISAHAIWLADRPRPGHLGHQGSHAPGRPILHRRLILSQTSVGKVLLRHRWLLTSRCSFVCAWRSFLRPGLRAQTRRAYGSSRPAVVLS